MSDNLPPKANLRPREVADYLDISLSTIYELLSDGELPCIEIRRQKRIPREAFLDWCRAQTRNPPAF